MTSVGVKSPDPAGDDIFSISDRRMKKSIRNLKNSLGVISSLRGVYFNWREEIENMSPNEIEIGLIAQEVQRVESSLVEKLDNDRLAINYVSMIPIIIDAINELQSRDSETADDILSLILQCGEKINELELDDAYLQKILQDQDNKVSFLKMRINKLKTSRKLSSFIEL